MTEFGNFKNLNKDLNSEETVLSMFDEDGNALKYHVLAIKEEENSLYMLAEEGTIEPMREECMADVFIFKRVTEGKEDDVIFELVDEEHESFGLAFSLFKNDLDTLGIEY